MDWSAETLKSWTSGRRWSPCLRRFDPTLRESRAGTSRKAVGRILSGLSPRATQSPEPVSPSSSTVGRSMADRQSPAFRHYKNKTIGSRSMKKSSNSCSLWLLSLGFLVAASTAVSAAETTIPVILPLSGNASFLGQGIQRVLKVVEAVVNKDGGISGRQLRFAFRDDQTSPQVAVQLTNALAAPQPAVIMGSGLGAMCNARAPLVRNGPVDYCLSPAAQPMPGSFMYSTNTSTRDLIMADFRFFKSRGWTRVATISSSDATGQDFEKGVDVAIGAAENRGIEI